MCSLIGEQFYASSSMAVVVGRQKKAVVFQYSQLLIILEMAVTDCCPCKHST